MKYRWQTAAPQTELCSLLAERVKISKLLAQCLLNRGLADPEETERFLSPRLKNLADPFLLPNMAAAVERLLQARERNELLVIFGDYDVDGVTTTALLLEALKALGWQVQHYLPHRMDEGYGFNLDAIRTCLAQFPATLLLAVDCGSTSVESISTLRERGIDVIVMDHHQVSNPAPPAVALVNPQLAENFRELCSVGLAFKLVHALVKRMRDAGIAHASEFDLRPYLDLVALGTIADLAPLKGENRILVFSGLERLNSTQRAGLQALKSVARSGESIGSYEVAFQLSPRLNAAGRMETAEAALQLLLAKTLSEAEPLAQKLDACNRERQEVERGICQEVIAVVRAGFDGARDFVIVEGNSNWHIGVVGIVAARVLQEFHRPTIILGGDGTFWRGSGRSIEGFDLAAALRDCGELLTRHGGHAMAAGVTVSPDKIEVFRSKLNDLARQSLKGEHLQPSIILDVWVTLDELTVERVEELNRLEPMGHGNHQVRLGIKGLNHRYEPLRMGQDGKHTKLRVTDGHGVAEAVWWNCGSSSIPEGKFDLAVSAAINEYRGTRSVQLKLLDWRESD